MYHDNDSILGSLLSILFLGFAFYLTEQGGRHAAYKEMEQKQRDKEFEDMKRQLNELKRQRAS